VEVVHQDHVVKVVVEQELVVLESIKIPVIHIQQVH
jgi:hypothetical protein